MEVYFKNLTPEEGMTDKLLHDLHVLGENSEELFRVSEGKLAEKSKEKFLLGLERVKATCRRLHEQAVSNREAAAEAEPAFPYATMGIVFGLGILMGILARGNPGRNSSPH